LELFLIHGEIYSGKDLSELFGGHLISSLSVPILEELFNIKSGCLAEKAESLFKFFSEIDFLFGERFLTIHKININRDWDGSTRSLFKIFDRENFIDGITEISPEYISFFLRTVKEIKNKVEFLI
jgi:hypothetical protein